MNYDHRGEANAKVGYDTPARNQGLAQPSSQPPQQVLDHIMQRLAETHAHLMENNNRLRNVGDSLLGTTPDAKDAQGKVDSPNGKVATLERLAIMIQEGMTENRHLVSRLEVL